MSGSTIGGSGNRQASDLLADLRSGRIAGSDARLRAATTLLEATFYEELFKVMRDTVPDDGVVPSGGGQEMFESLLDQKVAESAAVASDSGLGSALYRFFTGGIRSQAAIRASEPPASDGG